MNILYLGTETGTSGHRKAALLRLGHQVTGIDPYTLLPRLPGVGAWRRQTGGAGLVELVRSRVLGELDRSGPASSGSAPFDLAWIDHGDLIGAPLVDDLKARIPRVLCYNIDDPFGGRDRRLWRAFHQALPRYDLFVTVREVNVEEARRQGAKAVMRVYMSADEIAHAPVPLTASDRDEWKSEVVFVGTAFPERGPFLSALAKLGVPLTLYGNGYPKLPQWPVLRRHWSSRKAETREGYAKAIGAAKVCLGLLSRGNRDQHTTRSMEIPSLGGLLCAERTSEHLDLYEEDREAVFWESPEECAAKCFALLADAGRRTAIVVAGRRRYLKSPWQNNQVVQSILDAAVPCRLDPTHQSEEREAEVFTVPHRP